MRKPNLFIVGHPRTGTSSLHDYLSQHPDILMSTIKEPNFFAKDFHAESDAFHKKQLYFPFRTEKQYATIYRQWKNERIAGEASATTLYSKISAQEIKSFNPEANIIMTFRELVDFLYSLHSTAVFSLGETIKDFNKALLAEEKRRNGNLLSKRVITPSFLFYSEFIAYTEQLKRFLIHFPPEQIKVNIFDDFKRDTNNALKDIFSFLKVDSDFVPDLTVVNPYKKTVKYPRLKYFLFDSPYFRKLQRKIFPVETYARLVKLYKKRILTDQPKQKLDDQTRKEVMSRFKREVEQFSEFIGRDLVKLWKYDQI